MNTRKKLCLAALVISVGLTGCSDDGNGNPVDGGNADTGNGGDGGGGDGGGGGGLLDGVPDATTPSGAADYACNGDETAPATGSSTDFTLNFDDFGGMTAPGSICVSFYDDNMIPMSDSCAASGQMTDTMGALSVTDPDASWYAYRVYPSTTTLGVIQKNEAAPASGGSADAYTVSPTTAQLIPGILGLSQDPADGIFAGAVSDCNGDLVNGAVFRVVKGGTIIPEGPMQADAHYEYFNGTGDLPQAGQDYTNDDGQFLGANIPVGTEGEQVELIACANVGGTPTLIGCEETRAFAGYVNIVNLGPLRSDGPAACSGLESLCQ